MHPVYARQRIEPQLLSEKLFDFLLGAVLTTTWPQLRLRGPAVFTATRFPSAASFVMSPEVE
jgi:hypothetical protein